MAKIHTCNVKIYLLYIYKKQDKRKKIKKNISRFNTFLGDRKVG